VLDDGFQHRSLERDVDLVIVQPDDLAGRRLPFGRLRSAPRTLATVDAILVDGATAESIAPALQALGVPAATPRFTVVRTIDAPWLLEGEGTVARDGTVIAAAAIARPERFVRALEADGWRVAGTLAFADHHDFTRRDLARIAEAAQAASAGLVLTTEKDAMRLLRWRPLPVRIAAVPLTVSLEPREAFGTWLLARLREVRA
jgi:tetraacyldisaccharide 4'-kinase